jgi:hypothetical protein
MSKVFITQLGGVALSEPFSMFGFDEKQVELTYKPTDYDGWGITKSHNAIEVRNFCQADADIFARFAESILRTDTLQKASSVNCKHGVIICGYKCLSCEHEARADV